MEERFLKLSNTAYKIIDFLPESDPLKNKAKEKVLEILENLPIVFGSDGWISLQKDKAASQMLLDIDLFLSYIKIAKEQKWIDQINYLILLKEYQDLRKDIPVPKFSKQALPEKSSEPQEAKTEKPQAPPKSKAQNTNPQDLTDRQKKILEMLNDKEKAQVSDIIKIMPDVTKRTIRRDLDGLLEMGKVVRVGQWNQVFYQAFKSSDNLPQIKPDNDRTVILS